MSASVFANGGRYHHAWRGGSEIQAAVNPLLWSDAAAAAAEYGSWRKRVFFGGVLDADATRARAGGDVTDDAAVDGAANDGEAEESIAVGASTYTQPSWALSANEP